MTANDTIAAPVTPPGQGGVGIVRVSGPDAAAIAQAVAGPLPSARTAVLRHFRDPDGRNLDQGLLLWFPAPGSYTGEDCVEFQGHGGPAVVDAICAHTLAVGARMARPGEFSERAFLNGRLDLTQAEAVADLIASSDAAGVRAAARTLEGAFSDRLSATTDELTALRAWIEAALDFPDDEVDHLADERLAARLDGLIERLATTTAGAMEGRRLVEGATLVIAGAPNAGKSSLLNALVEADRAIVTTQAGTTRDTLHEAIQLDGVPLTLIDTAGLRASDDPIEVEGVRRARDALAEADRILWLVDTTAAADAEQDASARDLPADVPIDVIRNKIDYSGEAPGWRSADGGCWGVSATTGTGLTDLRGHLRQQLGTGPESGAFSARRHHLDALARVDEQVRAARAELQNQGAGELAAERLRSAQEIIGEITGATTTEDLLGEIFARFCIGK